MPAELSANTDSAASPAADEPAEPQASANPSSLEAVRPRCHISLRLPCCIISYLGAACLCPRNLSANAHAATCPTAEPEQASARSLITATMWSTKWTSSLYSIRRVDASSVAFLFNGVPLLPKSVSQIRFIVVQLRVWSLSTHLVQWLGNLSGEKEHVQKNTTD